MGDCTNFWSSPAKGRPRRPTARAPTMQLSSPKSSFPVLKLYLVLRYYMQPPDFGLPRKEMHDTEPLATGHCIAQRSVLYQAYRIAEISVASALRFRFLL